MGFLSKLFGQSRETDFTRGLPQDWRQTLRQCDFIMAEREIADFFRIANQEAKGKGEQVVYKNEFVQGWKTFSDNPCYESAVSFLEVAPIMFCYFLGCCPERSTAK